MREELTWDLLKTFTESEKNATAKNIGRLQNLHIYYGTFTKRAPNSMSSRSGKVYGESFGQYIKHTYYSRQYSMMLAPETQQQAGF